jgi:tetratricopeptide (TPR) repeat protein
MTSIARKLTFTAGGLTVAAGLWLLQDEPAVAQSTPPEPPAPLYSGQDSIGARPNAQLEHPALFFEAKAPWPALGIEAPRTAWEHAQRGMYRQDDLEDVEGAIEDYEAALALDGHLLVASARLGYLALERGLAAARAGETAAAEAALREAVERYAVVCHEQPSRQGVRLRQAQAYLQLWRLSGDAAEAERAEATLREELALAPTQQEAFWALAQLYDAQGRAAEALDMVRRYLAEAEIQGDPYPWRVRAAEQLRTRLGG